MDKEFIMRGNSAILKCSIPSFVADFVFVVAWVDQEGTEIIASNDFTESKKHVKRKQFGLKILLFVYIFYFGNFLVKFGYFVISSRQPVLRSGNSR